MAYGNQNQGGKMAKIDRFGNPYITHVIKHPKKEGGNPYFYAEIGGKLYKIDVNTDVQSDRLKDDQCGYARITQMKKRENIRF